MEKILKNLLEEFKTTIPEADEELCQFFERYLLTHIESLQKDKECDENMIQSIITRMGRRIIQSDLDMKKKTLIPDENLDIIKQISKESYYLANDIVNGKKIDTSFDIEETINRLCKLPDGVKDFNKQEAEKLVSEGILDLRFVENPNTEIVSLRLGRDIQMLQNKKREEELRER